MKISLAKLAATTQHPAFPTVLRLTGASPKAVADGPAPEAKGQMFSHSTDLRDERGARQMKHFRNSKAFPHVR